MKVQSNFLLLLLLSVVLIISSLSLFQKSQTQPLNPPIPQITEIVDTSNWKTYANAKQAYTLKYPSNWKQTVDTDGNPYFWPNDTESLFINASDKPFKKNEKQYQVIPFREILQNNKYFIFYVWPTPNPNSSLIYHQIINTFKYEETEIYKISRLELPKGLEPAQIQVPEKINNFYFVKFLKSSMNSFLNSSVQRSGILVLDPLSKTWKLYIEILDKIKDSSSKNNPYQFWQENNSYYLVIVDTGGAGSGEGIGKLININSDNNKYQTIHCFYFNPGSYYNFLERKPDNFTQSQWISQYNTPFEGLPKMPQKITSPECTNFLLKVYSLPNQDLFCGGIAAIPCPSGFSCQLDGSFPDAGGVCLKK